MKEVPIRFATARIPTQHGEFTAYAYSHQGWEHLVYQFGEVSDPALVRIHSECLTGDTLGSIRCDCGEQLRLSLATIAEAGSGILIYLRGQEGRGIGIGHKIKAYELQDKGHDTVDANLMQGLPADSRDYGVAAQILQDLSVARVRLLTNNPAKNLGLASWGIEIVERLPLEASPNKENIHYLRTKRDRLGHDIQNLEPGEAIS